MSWLQIELGATPDNLADIEAVLAEAGAVSVTLISAADEPVLEPAPGETPLWESVVVRALFALDVDVGALRRSLLVCGAGGIDTVEFIGARDWTEAARTYAVDRVFAGRLHLRPKVAEAPPASAAGDALVPLYLEPGLAFGSGSHPTTSLCLEWVAANVQTGMRVLDFGCGSGLLGIGAALLGAEVVAVDHDEQAIMATRENAAYNGITEQRINVMSLDAWQAHAQLGSFDVVVANILAGPLRELAGTFESVTRQGAHIVLSGVLEEQAADVMQAYANTTFAAPRQDSGWVLLTGVRT